MLKDEANRGSLIPVALTSWDSRYVQKLSKAADPLNENYLLHYFKQDLIFFHFFSVHVAVQVAIANKLVSDATIVAAENERRATTLEHPDLISRFRAKTSHS
jgi:hypothetical protein